MTSHPLSLDHLTCQGASAVQMTEIAAELGCKFISPMIDPAGRKTIPCFQLERGSNEMRELQAALTNNSVQINNMDFFPLLAEVDWRAYELGLDVAAELGAKAIIIGAYDENADRALETFCRLGEVTRARGLHMALEFMPLSQVKTAQSAVAFLRRAGQPNAGLQVDSLHVYNSGGSARDVAQLDPNLVWSAQICDGQLGATREEYAYAARFQRERPGDGAFPLQEFVAALPPSTPIGVEVPRKSEMDAGVSPLERARLSIAKTRAVLKAALGT